MGLQQVRQLRDEYLVLWAENIDPKQYRDQTKYLEKQRITKTFRCVAQSWKASKADTVKALTLGNYPISEITPFTCFF